MPRDSGGGAAGRTGKLLVASRRWYGAMELWWYGDMVIQVKR